MDLGRKTYAGERLGLGERLVDTAVERLVRDKVRERFGGRLKALVSGGAPLNHDVGTFFTALGLRLLQGYGQTEAGPVIACNPCMRVKLDTVGPPLKRVNLRIADDGEILVNGPLLMDGYWNLPDLTSNVLRDGWLHTGDIGEIDADGYLKITDRKKDIIVNSGGDTISPQRVECHLALEPEIEAAMVVGDNRPHLVGIVVPAPDFMHDWSTGKRRRRPVGQPRALVGVSARDQHGHRSRQQDAAQQRARETLHDRRRGFLDGQWPHDPDHEAPTP